MHDAGGLCSYDQANANGLFGIARARDAGFDLCQFNLHKSFGSPHGAAGLATGACGASEQLERFLPVPLVAERDGTFTLDDERPDSIGKVRAFYGAVPTVIRAYCWVRSLGADGLRTVAETAVLNNNYLAARLRDVPGLDVPYRRRPTAAGADQVQLAGVAGDARGRDARRRPPRDRLRHGERTSPAITRGSSPSR